MEAMKAQPAGDPDWLPRKKEGKREMVQASAPSSSSTPPSASNSVESGAKLVDDTEQFIRRYMALPEHAYLPLALWSTATHLAEEFDCFPYVAAVSPMKRSGKTRLAETLELLVRRPWRGTAPSPAALYRMLEDAPTLLLDEIEALNGKNKSETSLILLAVLNAGHRKGATIPRCDGPHHEVRHFPVYGPKFFAAIGKLPDTLSDRSIVVKMKRRTKAQPVARFRQGKAAAEAKPLHDAVERFAEIARGDIRRAYQQVVENDLTFLNDRDADIWSPLFAVCRVAAPDRWSELEKCARELSKAKAGDDADDSWKLTLLRDIRAVWPDGEDKFETSLLLAKLNVLEESPWKEHPLTSRKLAGMLRPFEVEPRTIRIDDVRTAKGYCYEQLKDAFDRYLEK